MAENNGLPQSWRRTTIGEIVSFEYGKGLRKDRREEIGDIPVYGSNGIVGYHSKALVDSPCLVVGRKGTAGAVHRSKGPCWPIDTTYYVIPPNGINLSFLFYLLSSLQLEKLDRSTAIPGLNRNDAYAVEIAIPPLPEQHRIVAKIEELFTQLDAGVAELQQAKARLRRYRQAVLKAAVEGELTREWREGVRAKHSADGQEAETDDSPNASPQPYEPAVTLLKRILSERRAKWEAEGGKGKYKGKYPEPAPPDTDGLPELPEGWVWTNLDSLITLSQNGFGKRRSKTGTPTIVLRLADITNGTEISLTNVRRIGATEEEIEKYRLYENDLICIRVNGSPNLVGRFVKFESAPETVIFCDHFIRFRLVDSETSPYLEYFCNSQRSRRFVDLNKVSSAGQNTVSQATMKDLAIALPPIKEQVRLVEMVERRLSVADEIEKELDQALARAERLRQSILKRAFEGRLV